MKKLFTLLLLTLFLGLGGYSYSQVFYTEGFDTLINPVTDLPSGWTESGLSSDSIWSTNNATGAPSVYFTWPASPTSNDFAYTCDDACDCDKSNDRMFMPVQSFAGMNAVNMTSDLFLIGGYGESGYILASNNGGSSFDTVYTLTGAGTVWQTGVNVNLSAYAGDSAVIICFAYNDGGNWAWAMAVDNIVLTELASAEDLEVIRAVGEYTKIPETQATSIPLDVIASNNGLSNVTDAVVTANVYSSSNGFSTPVQTTSSSATTLNTGDTLTINAGSFVPMMQADYRIDYSIAATSITDGIANNDSASYAFEITNSQYARDDSVISIGLGINGTGNTSILGNNYYIDTATTVNSVTFGVGGVGAGDTTRLFVYNTDLTGMPTTVIDSFEYYFINAGPTVETILIPGGLPLTQGTYYFGIKEMPSISNLGLQGSDNLFTPGTVWGSINGGPFDLLENVGFRNSFLVRLNLDNGCIPTSATLNEAICQGDVFTLGGTTYDSAGTYMQTLVNSNGCDSVVTLNLAVNQLPVVSFSGLDTLYCANDAPATLTGSPAGGTFSGNGVTGNTFDPTAVAVGFHNITYTYADSNNCDAAQSQVTQVDNCTGIGEGIFGNVSVSPNPNNGIFTLSGLEPGMSIKLYNIHGQVMLDKVVSYTEELVELQDKAAGTYFLWLSKKEATAQFKIQVR